MLENAAKYAREYGHKRIDYYHFQASDTTGLLYLMQHFGIPNRYYVDNLRVFCYIHNRDSVWKKLVLGADDVNTQWRQVLALMNTDLKFCSC